MKRFTRTLVSCPLKKHEVWKIYNTVYIPSVKYSLGTTAIEDKYLEDIQRLLTTKKIARLGYVSMFPQAVAFGPKHYRGIGILTLKGIILEEKVTLLLRHIRSSSIRKQLQIMLDWSQHSSRTSMPLLEDPH
eukprot:4650173-Ditylum_brightwellii.AAC.1